MAPRLTRWLSALAMTLPLALAAVVAADDDTEARSTLKDVLTGTLQDTIQGAIDGSLQDTLQQKVQQKVQDALVDPPHGESDDSSSQTKVVLRISKEFVRQHAPPTVEETSPVDRSLFGAHVTGTATTRGQPSLTMDTDRLVDDLINNVPWNQTVALLVPQDVHWISHFDNTMEWLVISPGPEGAMVPELPGEAARLKAPLELWVHGKPNELSARKLIALWGTVQVGLNRFRDLTTAQDATVTQSVQPTVVGDWWVLRVGTDILEQFIDGLREDESDGSD